MGSFFDARARERPFLWTEQTGMTALSSPRGTFGEAYGINNRGQAVGFVFPPDLSRSRAVMWWNGTWTNLGSLPGLPDCGAFAVNQRGEVVGGCGLQAEGSTGEAFL